MHYITEDERDKLIIEAVVERFISAPRTLSETRMIFETMSREFPNLFDVFVDMFWTASSGML